MEPILTPASMAEADRRAIAGGTSLTTLMERAGRAVAWAAREMFGGCYGKRAVVFCGKGNNGGDGRIAARVLGTWGARVDVIDSAASVERHGALRSLARADLVVDAMLGTGFRGELDGDTAWIADAIVGAGVAVLAVDIPSGVDGTTGAVRGPAVQADVTVTFAARKTGIVFEPGRSRAGRVQVADIGIPIAEDLVSAHVLEPSDLAAMLPERPAESHKWNAAVLVVGGSAGMTGAPVLASRAAMRAGAGMVFCCTPGAGKNGAAAGAADEVITRVLPATAGGALGSEAVDELSQLEERFAALALGPGLGRDPETEHAVRDLLQLADLPLVLDADGLNAFAGQLGDLPRGDGWANVLTPHDGEYERLVGHPVGDDRIAAARELADASGAVVLLKGATTVVAAPGDEGVFLNLTGTPLLATAGTGDVLTGIVAAFLALDIPALQAAAAAAWVHGRAAQLAAAGWGHDPTSGLVAGDVVASLPSTLGEIRETGGFLGD